MSNPRQSVVILVPDDGQRYTPGAPFNVVRTEGRVTLVADPRGAYEVYSCEPAPELVKDPLLRVVLRAV